MSSRQWPNQQCSHLSSLQSLRGPYYRETIQNDRNTTTHSRQLHQQPCSVRSQQLDSDWQLAVLFINHTANLPPYQIGYLIGPHLSTGKFS